MKRRISLLLAVVMVLGSFSAVFAAPAVAKTEAEAAEFLKEKGVLMGNTTGDLELDKILKKEDSVIMLSRLMGVEKEAKEHVVTEAYKAFKDITDQHYKGYISWAVEEKYFEGNSKTVFGFREDMTVQNYSVVLLRALGYESTGHEDWKGAFKKATDLGLLTGLEIKDEKAKLTRGQMSLMTYNALGTNMNGKKTTLAEELKIEMPKPDVLKVEAVSASNLKEVEVKFNKAVTQEELKDGKNFKVTGTNSTTLKFEDNIEIKDEKTAVLTLVDGSKFTNGRAYKLEIENLKDINGKYDFNVIDNAIPTVVAVEGLGTKAIRVEFSEPVENVKRSSFKLDDKSFSGSVEPVGLREVILKPYTTMTEGTHKLEIIDVKDFAGFTMFKDVKEFEVVKDVDGPKVKSVTAINDEKIVVEFEKAVDKATVNNKSIAWGGNRNATSFKVLSAVKYEFAFTGDSKLPVGQVLVQIQDIKDYSGTTMKSQTATVVVNRDEVKPTINKLEVTGDREIELTFNKSLDKTDAQSSSNYKLTNSKNNVVRIAFITYNEKDHKVKLILAEDLNKNENYNLEVSGIRDNSKLNVMEKETRTFQGKKGAEVKVSFVKYADNKITVTFNRPMDASTLENKANYSIMNGSEIKAIADKIDEVVIVQDGRGAELKLKKDHNLTITPNTTKLVLSANIKDVEGNTLSSLIADIKADTAVVELAKKDLVLAKNNVLELTFDNDIKAVKKCNKRIKLNRISSSIHCSR